VASLADLRLAKMVSQTRQLRGRIYSEREESNFAEIGRLVDYWQPVEVFNGTEFRVGSLGRVWRTRGSKRSCRREDSYVAVIILSVKNRYWPELDVWLIFGSL
jgi:hypothetical protein